MATAKAKLHGHVAEFTNEPFIDFSKPENQQEDGSGAEEGEGGVWARVPHVDRGERRW